MEATYVVLEASKVCDETSWTVLAVAESSDKWLLLRIQRT